MPPASGPRGFLRAHWQRLEQGGHHDAWVSTTSGTIPRGVPYQARARSQRCVVNHGLWTNVIDYDAVTQLSQVRTPTAVGVGIVVVVASNADAGPRGGDAST
jgi:hypothetical protein